MNKPTREPGAYFGCRAAQWLVLVSLAAAALPAGCTVFSRREPPSHLNAAVSYSDLATTNLSGEPVTLEPHRGQVVLLDVWATWCAPCIEGFPVLQSLHDQYKGRGFTVVGVSLDTEAPGTLPALLTKHSVRYPVVVDSTGERSVREALDINTVPTLVLFDRRDRMLRRWTGQPSDEELKAAVIRALQE